VDVHHIVERARGGVHSRKNCLCLCGTHHRMLHERQLVITGDPEGAIEFFDGAGRRLADAGRPEGAVTHCGSSGDAAPMVSAEARRVLATMGARGGWSSDDLCEATGLPAATVGSTLIFCELAGQVRRDEAGRYQAVH
jgi:predicted Rossmann fold nucleotide-binding protein DprA/Smf involved in DNA uptake